ncbi:MAG: Rrf2 family transcriptional regulator, nitric oxide-sensitive transcriptional repressor [Candidatus Sumerlaeota bacterium]|nr:Rrf2 family transcriptional regulator, nitric oxide-sensitive transcriptional repressor [Candidatus Sumerlaeota bacterium]
MITKTSEFAIKALVVLALEGPNAQLAPRDLATRVGTSPSYLSKTMSQLVKVGILRSQRGPSGGVMLARPAAAITLRDIVEACQGMLIGAYCQAIGDAEEENVCAYHAAMYDVRKSTADALGRWSLADLTRCPLPRGELAGNLDCRMGFLREHKKS